MKYLNGEASDAPARRPSGQSGTVRTPKRTASVCGVVAAAIIALAGCAWTDDSPSAPVVTVTATPPASSTPDTEDPTPIADVDAEVIEHAGNSYLVVTLPLDDWDVRVEWDPDDPGTMLRDVVRDDPTVAVATNAGIFTESVTPGGLLVSHGEELVPINLNEGGGNFHLMPNAVFVIYEDATAAVVDSRDYSGTGVIHATQSGPALVLNGDIHPQFNEGSTNLAFRSGVGVNPAGDTVYLAISWSFTNFWDFATLFRDELAVDDALYLDGDISRLWITGMSDPGPIDGPYAGVITARVRD